MSPAAGTRLGVYEVIAKLGEGGMGEVYRARDTKLLRSVAIKVLPDAVASDPDRSARFEREARVLASLNHPHIAALFGMEETAGRHFLVMELVEGETLAERIARGPLPIDTAIRIALQIAEALEAAHQRGIVHRDLKPANVKVAPDENVKVLDFGLARAMETTPGAFDQTSSPTVNTLATEAGMILGTAAYMSPEQAAGRRADARSDIFAFGALLYEMLTGQRAFQRASLIETAAAILHQEPEPLPARVVPDLAAVIRRCLKKDPSERYQKMADVKVALEELEERSSSRRHRRTSVTLPSGWHWPALAALTLVAVVSALVMWQPWRTEPVAEPLRAVALTTLPGIEQSPSLSPDGNYVVFAWTGPKQDNQDIYVQMIGSGSPLRLTSDSSNDYNPVWSPDGRFIAFFRSEPPAPTGLRRRELRLIPPLGGPERKLGEVHSQDIFPVGLYLAWSPDSASLVVTDSPGEGKPDALFVVSLDTGEKRQLTTPQPPALADISPAVSPDGRSLAFLRRTTWAAGELHLLPLGPGLSAGGEPRRLTSLQLGADYPAWTPGGEEIVFSAKGSLWRLPIGGSSEPMRIPYVGEDGLTPAITPSQPGKPARLVYVRSFRDGNFWRLDTPAAGAPASSAPVLAIASTRMEYHAQFSPDGGRVAFNSWRSGEAEIWISAPDGSNAIQLTSMGAVDTNCPCWSPDGQQIAFSSTGDGEWDLYAVPAAGGRPRRLTSHPAIDLCPTFSRDGQWLYFNSTRSGDFRIWKMPAAGGNALQVSPNQGTRAMEDADGKNLYYTSVSVDSPLWRLPLAGGEPVKVLDGIVWFNFSLTGRGAYYIDRLQSETRLQHVSFDTGKSTIIARNLGDVGAYLTASPDGRPILFNRNDSSGDDLMLVENFR